jgi:hypothetical protein
MAVASTAADGLLYRLLHLIASHYAWLQDVFSDAPFFHPPLKIAQIAAVEAAARISEIAVLARRALDLPGVTSLTSHDTAARDSTMAPRAGQRRPAPHRASCEAALDEDELAALALLSPEAAKQALLVVARWLLGQQTWTPHHPSFSFLLSEDETEATRPVPQLLQFFPFVCRAEARAVGAILRDTVLESPDDPSSEASRAAQSVLAALAEAATMPEAVLSAMGIPSGPRMAVSKHRYAEASQTLIHSPPACDEAPCHPGLYPGGPAALAVAQSNRIAFAQHVARAMGPDMPASPTEALELRLVPSWVRQPKTFPLVFVIDEKPAVFTPDRALRKFGNPEFQYGTREYQQQMLAQQARKLKREREVLTEKQRRRQESQHQLLN